ncbi:MAG: alpha/beta hydrolase fold domain-containing protein, partial [Aquabacterium sp.]|nr:alpha/beta hydrolase fold domain-containing protein [Ferruginibacter sp.]
MKYLNSFACSVITLSILFLGSCSNNTNTDTPAVSDTSKTKVTDTLTEVTILKPAAAKPAWGKDLTDPMTVIIEKLGSYKAPSLTTLSAQEARKQPTPADATMDVIKEHKITATASNADTMSKMIMVKGGEIPVRIYTPKTGKASYPVIVYYHGGGWVIANLDTYNASAEGLANQVDAIVISVAYRQGPEFKFPTAHNDSYAAYEWAVKNAASIKGDPKKIA